MRLFPQLSREPQKQRRRDCLLLALLLLGVFALVLPLLNNHPSLGWIPSAPDSFSESLCDAFGPSAPAAYTPTPNVSLTWDFFLFGSDHILPYRLHSALAVLSMAGFLFLLLRKLRAPATAAFAIAFLAAIQPANLFFIQVPELRGGIAMQLFCSAALWCATHCTTKCRFAWCLGCTAACILAMGASVRCALLMPLLPAVAWWCRPPSENAPRKYLPLLMPEFALIACTILSLHMAGRLF